ncbi:hypothetical protein [Anabaena sp. CA = ATCC 33047]|uniref:hypothetical protein n=1 Tax=Anabaena sp. (strain CA / ATCC 33047) TaxID=52271 RepID=UPI00082F422D|nr:hypothetical protein [Anabaena sp. CA = ATCC 33047]
METVTLTAVATAIASIITTLFTKAVEKSGENLGDAVCELINQLRQKGKSPLLTSAVEENEPQRLDFGQAVLELTEAAQDPEIAQAVVDVEAAVNNDQSETAKEIKQKAAEIESQPSVVNNFAKLAEQIHNVIQAPTFNGPVTFG